MPRLVRNSNNLNPVVRFPSGNILIPKKSAFDNFGDRWVQVNNYWYKVHKHEGKNTIIKGSAFILKPNGTINFAPNNTLNRRNVYAVFPNEDRPSPTKVGNTVTVVRSGPNSPWRLLNEQLAKKYNLRMNMAMGLWGAKLTRKNR